MAEASRIVPDQILKAAALSAAVLFAFSHVLQKLARDWWSDENYSHGLLIPFVIGLVIWLEWDTLRGAIEPPSKLGWAVVAAGSALLLAGTVASELFTQRIALMLVLAGLVVHLFGWRLLRALGVPFALLLLAIPIPQILFNRIALPLQMWASQMAVWGIRLFEVPTVRNGNVIDILPKGSTQAISLEVVEACSGIRSLMTLMTLAVVLAYFTRVTRQGRFGGFTGPDLGRAIILVLAAIPIAVATNACRVSATGIMTYWYGKPAAEGTIHDVSGWLVYIAALGILLAVNAGVKRLQPAVPGELEFADDAKQGGSWAWSLVAPMLILLAASGAAVNYLARRAELPPERVALAKLPTKLGDWRQKGQDILFDKAVQDVLGASDYTMREYAAPDGRISNIYVGYYASQRTGATYHSPQNCLPGAGWVLHDPAPVEITTRSGRTFTANRYLMESGVYREVMIYWYQGRGRTEASEYHDKLNTLIDSVTRRRTDGAMVRVMTSVGSDEPAAIAAAVELSARLAEELDPFIPE